MIDAPTRVLHQSLVEMLDAQAEAYGYRTASVFCRDDGERVQQTYAELTRRARAIAAELQRRLAEGDRALLVFPPGLDFIAGFFGCLYAGVLAVPATYPKPRRPMPRLAAIAQDCRPTAVLTTSQTLATAELVRKAPELAGVQWIAIDEIPDTAEGDWQRPALDRDSLAFLQYTSGSTSDPKGVMVSHGNLLYNLEMIYRGFGFGHVVPNESCGAFWLPSYHDMGLIGGILEPLYTGGQSVLMSPASFLQRPLRWLQMISEYGATISGAPNFAYELCVQKITPQQCRDLDLSNWRVAFCGAEPIRPSTLESFAKAFGPCGFREDAFYPCYGLAEATLIVSGGDGPRRPTVKTVARGPLAQHRVVEAAESDAEAQPLVGCGGPLLAQEVIIVDPQSRRRCAEKEVGEIWIAGPAVAHGYWNRQRENSMTFGARLADGGDDVRYLRTGDLGFLADGQLFITGRRKDVIIIRGRNHYPQDLERTAQSAHHALCSSGGAVFALDGEDEERLVVVHEVDRQFRDGDYDEMLRAVRREIAREHDVEAHAVVLIRQADLPRTTSGKVQRQYCRQRYLAGDLKVLAQWIAPSRAPAAAYSASNGANGAAASAIDLNGRHAKPANGHAKNGHAKNGHAKNGHTENGHTTNGHTTNGHTTNGHSNNGHTKNGHASNGHNGHRPAVEQVNGSKVNGHAPVSERNGHAHDAVSPSPKARPQPMSPEEVDRLAERIETWLLDWLQRRAEVPVAELDRDKPLADYGIDSLAAVELSHELENWLGIELTPVLAWNHPTAALLARYLASETAKAAGPCDTSNATPPSEPAEINGGDANFEALLAEIENLSDDEAQAAIDP
jgi:acyl-CoA synthetase (AMP-forming)/AMP-acid ligase II/acyl carrier protein